MLICVIRHNGNEAQAQRYDVAEMEKDQGEDIVKITVYMPGWARTAIKTEIAPTTTTQSRWIADQILDRLIELGYGPPIKYSSLQDLVEENREQLLKKSKLSEKVLDKISKTNQCTEVERLRIAIALGISEDDVAALQDNG